MDLVRTLLRALGLQALLGALLLGSSLASLAQSPQPIPALSARVMDLTGTLRADQTQTLEARLQAFEQAKGTQIVVLMVPTTAPEDITDYAQRVGDLWKIGRKQVGDGLLLVIAKNDRTLRIATAKTLEGAIPDLAARQVIDRSITPRFREGDYFGGIDAGLTALMALVTGEKLPEPQRSEPGIDWTGALVVFFFAVPILARIASALLGRKGGSLLTGIGIGLLAWLISASVLLAIAVGLIAAVYGLASTVMNWQRYSGRGSGGSGAGAAAGLPALTVAFAAVAAVTSAAAVPPAGGEEGSVMTQAMSLRQRLSSIVRALWLDAGDVERMLGRGWAEQLRQQIAQAEADSSAEIRLCVEAALPLRDLLHGGSADVDALVRRRAIGLFGELGVWDTEANTGVLIYVLLGEKAVEIVADRGLRGIASAQWEALAHALAQDLRAGLKEKALATAIERCHQLLATLNLPSDSAGNELPDAPQVR